MDLTAWELVAAIVAVGIGSCLQGALGFGVGLVGAPVLLLIDPALVPTVIIGLGTPITYLVAWRERRALTIRPVAWAITGRLPGTIVGSLAVAALSDRWLAALFAFALLSAVAVSVVRPSVAPTHRAMFAAGFGSGLMGTATSVGGPPMALVLQNRTGPQLRAAMGVFMAAGATFSLIALAAVGEFHGRQLLVIAALAPAALAGFYVSRWTNRFLDRGYTRQAVLLFATLSALSIVIRDVL